MKATNSDPKWDEMSDLPMENSMDESLAHRLGMMSDSLMAQMLEPYSENRMDLNLALFDCFIPSKYTNIPLLGLNVGCVEGARIGWCVGLSDGANDGAK